MIQLEWPWMLCLLPLPWLVSRFTPPASARRGGALRVPFREALGELPARRAGGRGPLLALLAVAWAALVLAAARPVRAGAAIDLPSEGRDVMLVMDLSGSMAREDFTLGGQPADRLTVAKEVATDFVRRREGDRLGLILFGTRPFLQAPLTFDRSTVASFLDDAEVGLAGEETAIGDALGLAVKRLRDRPADSRVVVLLTDGASNAGALDPKQAAEVAKAEGVRVHTIGVGAERMAVDTPFGTQVVNPSADLDEGALSQIAETTGGQFFRAKSAEGLARIYREIDRLEPVAGEPLHVRPTDELFHWPLAVAFMLSLGSGLSRVFESQTRLRAWR